MQASNTRGRKGNMDIIETLRRGRIRDELAEEFHGLGISLESASSLAATVLEYDRHPILEEIAIFFDVRDAISRRVEHASGIKACDIALNVAFGPLDAQIYESLPGQSQRPDGYRWTTLVHWEWSRTAHGLDPWGGELACNPPDVDMPPWAMSEVHVVLEGSEHTLYKFCQYEFELPAPWYFEFPHWGIDGEELLKPEGYARRRRT